MEFEVKEKKKILVKRKDKDDKEIMQYVAEDLSERKIILKGDFELELGDTIDLEVGKKQSRLNEE